LSSAAKQKTKGQKKNERRKCMVKMVKAFLLYCLTSLSCRFQVSHKQEQKDQIVIGPLPTMSIFLGPYSALKSKIKATARLGIANLDLSQSIII